MISGKLIRSTFIYTIIGALPLVSAFFLMIFYTNYLTRHDYGALVIYISFTAVMQILMNLGLDTYIGISYFDNRANKESLRQKIGSITGYLIIWGLVIITLSLFLGVNLFQLIFQGKDIHFFPYGFMAVVTAFCNSYFKTYTNLLINQEKSVRFAVVSLAHFVMTLGFSLTGLFMFPFTLIGPMWGRLLSGIGIFLIAFFSFTVNTPVKFLSGKELKQTLDFSIPVLLFFLLSWTISNIDQYIMKYFMTLSDVAIFGLAIQFTLLIEFILNGLSSAIMPKIFGIVKDQNLTGSTPELNKYFSGFNAVALLIIPASSFFIPLILPLFINKDFETSFLFLSALSIGFASRGLYNYFLTPVYLYKKTKILPVVYLITAVIQISTTIFMIRHYGIWGAVFSNLLTKILQNLFLYIGARRFFHFSFNAFKFIGLPIFVMATILISEFYVTDTNLHLVRLLQMLITYLLVWIFYRSEISALVQTLKGRYAPGKEKM
jgi:O-antigen/teichoic acid export membrane protein